jgi:pre-mRNA-splicing helicase BRR2
VAALTASGVTDPALLHTASFGIAYYHEAMSPAERSAVEGLYTRGLVSVVVATVSLAWGFPLTANVVVIMDTQQYDGREHRYVGYPIADMLQMMGRASRPGADNGTCVILCHSSR